MKMIENVLCLVLGTAISLAGVSAIYFGFAQLTILPVTWFFFLLYCVIGRFGLAWGIGLVSVGIGLISVGGYKKR